jgi:hypothetical protein
LTKRSKFYKIETSKREEKTREKRVRYERSEARMGKNILMTAQKNFDKIGTKNHESLDILYTRGLYIQGKK